MHRVKGVISVEEVLLLQAEVPQEDELMACNVLTMSSRGSVCL